MKYLLKSLKEINVSSLLAPLAPSFFANQLKNPFFIIGSARSGTSILLEVLGRHKDIAAFPGEANKVWHPDTYPWRHSKLNNTFSPFWIEPEKFTQTTLDNYGPNQSQAIRAIFGSYQFLKRKKCFLNKNAMINFMIPYILENIPNARFIHIVRDGRAVSLSYAKKEKQKIDDSLNIFKERGFDLTFEETIVACAHSWKKHIQEYERQKNAYSLEKNNLSLEVKYEDFCQHPKEILIHIAKFMGIESSFFESQNYSHVRNANYKFNESKENKNINEISNIIMPELKMKHYL